MCVCVCVCVFVLGGWKVRKGRVWSALVEVGVFGLGVCVGGGGGAGAQGVGLVSHPGWDV